MIILEWTFCLISIMAYIIASDGHRFADHPPPNRVTRLTLPAAAAAAPEKASAQGGSEVEKNNIKKTKRERGKRESEKLESGEK